MRKNHKALTLKNHFFCFFKKKNKSALPKKTFHDASFWNQVEWAVVWNSTTQIIFWKIIVFICIFWPKNFENCNQDSQRNATRQKIVGLLRASNLHQSLFCALAKQTVILLCICMRNSNKFPESRCNFKTHGA